MPRTKKYFTTKTWARFSIPMQERICQRFDVILTDHHTRKELGRKILKAILRPTPAQRKQQKEKLDKAIHSVTSGIDRFDDMMDELFESLRKQTAKGSDVDPVDLIMGKRNHAKAF